MTNTFHYYGRCEVGFGDPAKLTLPKAAFDDPRATPLTQRKKYRLYNDQDRHNFVILGDFGPFGNDHTVGEGRFKMVQGAAKQSRSVNARQLSLPKELVGSEEHNEFERDELVHLIADEELLSAHPHVYLVTTEQLDELLEAGWRPRGWLDIDRMNGDKFRREYQPAERGASGDTDREASDQISPPERIKVKLLGSTQGGGVPHIDCPCDQCLAARNADDRQMRINSIMVSDSIRDESILFEATPDIRFQVENVPDRIVLSHDLGGHISGLLALSVESIDTDEIPVYASEGLADIIGSGGPFQRLVQNNNVVIHAVEDGSEPNTGSPNISIRTLEFAHPWGETNALAHTIEGQNKRLFYYPDVTEWTERALDELAAADIAIVGGLIWDEDDLPEHEVPHMSIEETIDLFDEQNHNVDVYFTNLNHTNKVLYDESVKRRLDNQGYHIVESGMEFSL